MKRQMTRLRS